MFHLVDNEYSKMIIDNRMQDLARALKANPDLAKQTYDNGTSLMDVAAAYGSGTAVS